MSPPAAGRAALAVLIGAATIAVYAQVRDHAFVDFDDHVYITANPRLAGGLSSALSAFSEPYFSNWTPLTLLSLQLDHALYGTRPAGYLLTNVALHAASSVLLLLALTRMTGALGPAAFVAAVFALHPLHVESVAWASERKDVLSGLFWMLCLLAYARYAERPGGGRYALVLLTFALGLLAKPMLVTLPCVLLLLDFWPLGRLRLAPGRGLGSLAAPSVWGRPLLEKLPLFLLAAAFALVTYRVQAAQGFPAEPAAFSTRLANAAVSYGSYAVKSVWPSGLAAFYPYPLAVPAAEVAGAGLLLALITLAALRAARAAPYFCVGWLWYLGTLVPVIGLLQVGQQARADRYMYLPLIGLALAVAFGARDLARRAQLPSRALGLAGVLAVAALGVVSWRQVATWRDTSALFERALAVTLDNGFAHHRLGWALLQQGRLEEAEPHYAEVFRLQAREAEPRFELASALERSGRLEEAVAIYGAGIAIDPNHTRGRGFLGLALVRAGRFEEASSHLRAALRAHPGAAPLHWGLAAVAASRGELSAAVAHDERALALEPGLRAAADHLAWILATSAEDALRDPDEALRLARAGTRAAAPDPRALDTWAAAEAAAGRFDAALARADEALALALARGDAVLADAIRARMSLYRVGRPYLESATGLPYSR